MATALQTKIKPRCLSLSSAQEWVRPYHLIENTFDAMINGVGRSAFR